MTDLDYKGRLSKERYCLSLAVSVVYNENVDQLGAR